MGNRANLGLKIDDKHTIFLYQHWAPKRLFAQYADALHHAYRRIMMNDPNYASRMIITHIVGGDYDDEYGFGLAVNEILDNEHKTVIVDLTDNSVGLYNDIHGEPLFTMSIERFIQKYKE